MYNLLEFKTSSMINPITLHKQMRERHQDYMMGIEKYPKECAITSKHNVSHMDESQELKRWDILNTPKEESTNLIHHN